MIDLMVMKCLIMWLLVSCFAFLIFLIEKLQSKEWLIAALIINVALAILMMFFWALFHDDMMGLLT